MPDLSKVKLNNTNYNIKDITARSSIANLQAQLDNFDPGASVTIEDTASTTTSYYLTGTTETAGDTASQLYRNNNVYIQNDVMYGAAWNDYAEYRKTTHEEFEAGRVYKENGDGTLTMAQDRLEPGCGVASDTFGFAIGQTKDCFLPIAISGRVLAYTDKDPSTFKVGAPVCSGEGGTVSMMSPREERRYPSRIIGTVSEIPDYDVWHGAKDIQVNGRIWIKIK